MAKLLPINVLGCSARPKKTARQARGHKFESCIAHCPCFAGYRGTWQNRGFFMRGLGSGFLKVAGVQPTNNASERALRHAVIWRKLSFGTQSARGSRFVETILTVIETCRQQGRAVFDFLTTALTARYAPQQTPTLLPEA